VSRYAIQIRDTNDDSAGGLTAGYHPSRLAYVASRCLFGKYSHTYETHEESQAFADGVASVLTHMTKMECIK
jgi:hypothetical protein